MVRSVTVSGAPAGTLWRGSVVLLVVLAVHVASLIGIRNSLALAGPADVTQNTMVVALLRPVVVPTVPTVTAVPTPAPPAPRKPRAPSPAPAAPVAELGPAVDPAVDPEPAVAPPPSVDPAVEPAADPATAIAESSPMQSSADKLPTMGRIAYRTRYSGLALVNALTFVDWTIDRERATYQLWLRTVDPAGLLDLKSYGELKPFGIAPQHYIERIEFINRESTVDFDWAARMVSFSGPRAGPPVALTEGTQDPLSLQFHLPLLAQTFPWRFVPGAEVQFSVAYRRVETYTFTVVGWETVQVADRDIKALRIERRRGPNVRREVQMWLAPEFDWLTVKARFINTNDDVWESVLAHLPGVQPAPAEPIRTERITP